MKDNDHFIEGIEILNKKLIYWLSIWINPPNIAIKYRNDHLSIWF